MPDAGRDLTMLSRASTEADLALRHELVSLAGAGRITPHYLLGRRGRSWPPPLFGQRIRELVSDLVNLAAEAVEAVRPEIATRGLRLCTDLQPAPVRGLLPAAVEPFHRGDRTRLGGAAPGSSCLSCGRSPWHTAQAPRVPVPMAAYRPSRPCPRPSVDVVGGPLLWWRGCRQARDHRCPLAA